MAASFPNAKKTFTVKTNNVDLYDADHINELQEEVEALEQYVGNNPEGNQASLVARLAVLMDDNGAVYGSSSFPASSYARQLFYRTDQDQLYIRDQGNTSWTAIGAGLTNTVAEWHGSIDVGNSTDYGWVEAPSTGDGSTTTTKYRYFKALNATYRIVGETKFKKLASSDTLRIHARLWGNSGTSRLKITVDPDTAALTGEVTDASGPTSPGWVTSGTIDISSLTDGNDYTIRAELKNDDGGGAYAYCSDIVILGEA